MRNCGDTRKASRANERTSGVGRARPLFALLVGCLLVSGVLAQAQDAILYKEALTREAALRAELTALGDDTLAGPLVQRVRVMVGAYEDIWQLFPQSEYGDNALWQGGVLAADLFKRFGNADDRDTAVRLLNALAAEFPASPLRAKVPAQLARLSTVATPAARAPAPAPAPPGALLRGIRRDVRPEVVRVTLDLDREVAFTQERLADPPRVIVGLADTQPSAELTDATLVVGQMVRQVRVARALDTRTHLFFELTQDARFSIYALYNPYRLIVDFERVAAPVVSRPRNGAAATDRASAAAKTATAGASAVPPVAAPAAPASNAGGGFSLSRQLGLGVTRIAIDPGHGGHDPGAEVKGLTEAGLVLDVALRVEQLLKKEPRVEVLLTRRTDSYVSLDERTALANRSKADLLLSIHANASAAGGVRGVETYYLDFAPTRAAEAIAARENAGSSRSMRELSDLVEAIALTNKRDESRDFATTLQAALYERLRKVNRNLKNLGVKQAPFMVLVGAGMPAILAEIAFMTNAQEAALLKTSRYRQQIAEALVAAIMRYQQRVKTRARSG
jgi:N-acetylmuramoyl-L-alanine amidase